MVSPCSRDDMVGSTQISSSVGSCPPGRRRCRAAHNRRFCSSAGTGGLVSKPGSAVVKNLPPVGALFLFRARSSIGRRMPAAAPQGRAAKARIMPWPTTGVLASIFQPVRASDLTPRGRRPTRGNRAMSLNRLTRRRRCRALPLLDRLSTNLPRRQEITQALSRAPASGRDGLVFERAWAA